MATYDIKQAPKALDRKLRRRIDYVMRQIGMEADHVAKSESPIWSGAYVASWNLTRGSIDYSAWRAPEPWGEDTRYEVAGPAPPELTQLNRYYADLQPVYLTNSAEHAGLVEGYITPVRDLAVTYSVQVAPSIIRKAGAVE